MAGTLNATRWLGGQIGWNIKCNPLPGGKMVGTTNAARCVTCSSLLVPGLNFLAQSGRPMNN